MPTLEDLARRVEAFDQSDNEALARRVEQFSAPAAPDAGTDAWSYLRPALFPHPEIAGAVGRQIERGGEAAMAIPRNVADYAGKVSDAARAKFKMVAHRLAPGVFDDATDEERAAFVDLAIDKLLVAGPMAAGKVLSRPAESAAAALVRGGRSSAHTMRALGQPGPQSGAVSSVANELASRAAAGGIGAKVADVAPESIPGDLSEENEDLMGGLFGALGVQLSGLSDDLLRAHPQLARWATSAPRGKAGAVAGALIGLGLVAAKQSGMLGNLLGAEPTLEEPTQRRTSIGPAAIPPPQWGHRPAPGGVGPVAPQPMTRTVRR
jgi:hypothetical protein